MNPIGSARDNADDDIDHPYDVIDTTQWRAADNMYDDETQQQGMFNQETSYSMLGPEVDDRETIADEPPPDMHYEMVY